MKRSEFHSLFNCSGPVILPVIHVKSKEQTIKNVEKIIQANVSGCFLINHDFDVDQFIPIICETRVLYPSFWIGVNFLGVTGLDAFPILSAMSDAGTRIDAYWADDARINERSIFQEEAEAIRNSYAESNWAGLYFGGTAFKKQRPVSEKDFATAAEIAGNYTDVVTTSGIATGTAADLQKITTFRAALPDTPLALASGITPENARKYRMVDCFMVATGINIEHDFYQIDSKKLKQLVAVSKRLGSDNDKNQ